MMTIIIMSTRKEKKRKGKHQNFDGKLSRKIMSSYAQWVNIYIHTLPFKYLGSIRYLMFFKQVSCAHQGYIYWSKIKKKK